MMKCIIIGVITLLYFYRMAESQSASVSASGDTVLLPAINKTCSYPPTLAVMYDPPVNHFEPFVLGLFVRVTNNPEARIYYDIFGKPPTLGSPYAEYSSPYIPINTFFKGSRNRTVAIIAYDPTTNECSENIVLFYHVESSARPHSYAFLVPGLESSGYFIRVGLEMAATARATSGGSQEFADFYTNNGVGTYQSQINGLLLTSIDPELTGFEGGFPVNTSIGGTKQFGILVPYTTGGESFSGKVVRIDLQAMADNSTCIASYRMESYDENGRLVVTGPAPASTACIFVLDLKTANPRAVGFKRGFASYPYGYLSPGEFNVLVRLDMENFGLESTRFIDLNNIDRTFGGYSGGFADGSWACFCPFKTFAGPVGGIRSSLAVDAYKLKPYYYSVMLCVNNSAFDEPVQLGVNMYKIDFSIFDINLRGFSAAVRAGRYAYLAPLSIADHVYASKLVRLDLGNFDIGTTLAELGTNSIRNIIDILDLSKFDTRFSGYSGLFTAGNFLFLVPYRNSYEPKNGQRGHGLLTRLDMNKFDLAGIDFCDLTTTLRDQVPSFQDLNLRGFVDGFASGQYGVLVPFYNGNFNGKVARIISQAIPLCTSVQELDLTVDRTRAGLFKGYRGGFVSIWQGVNF